MEQCQEGQAQFSTRTLRQIFPLVFGVREGENVLVIKRKFLGKIFN